MTIHKLYEQISIEVSGTKTQTIFDEVFDKMVAEAQPIPGFRRVKGGNFYLMNDVFVSLSFAL